MSQKKPDEWLRETLIYLDKNYDLGKLYYPGSGWDRVPLETLGGKRVYHLSANENKGLSDFNPELHPPGEVYDTNNRLVRTAQEQKKWMQKIFEQGYFGVLGDDALYKYEGDYRHTHFFENNKFDSILIWGIPIKSTIEAIPEFRRVTKKGGLFIDNNELIYPSNSGDQDKISKTLDNQLKRLIFPGKLSAVPIYQN